MPNVSIVMRTLLCAILIALSCLAFGAGWEESGEVSYSYPVARRRLGFKMRRDGWRCVRAFTAGSKGEQEHSVWQRGDETIQMMLWRIDSGRTGFSRSHVPVRGQKEANQ